MRSTEAIPGKIYRLRRRERIRVEMLDTPADVRAARRMRVRFLSGVKSGEISDIPSVSIVPLIDSEDPSNAPGRRERGAPIFVPASGPLRPGATVALDDDEAGFEWQVQQLLPNDEVEIATTFFESRSVRTVSRDRVQLLRRRQPLVSERPSTGSSSTRRDDSFDETSWVAENLSPERPKRRLDAVVDSPILGSRCLQSCRDRYYAGFPLNECADRLRSEIRSRGALLSEGSGLRIRVPGRFEVILPEDVGADSTIDDPAVILDLRPLRGRIKNRPRSKPQRLGERPRQRRRRKRPKPS